jgi:hypothetical protein
MQTRQCGLTLGGLLVVLFIVIMLALVGFRVLPAYMEFFTARNAIQAIARDKLTSSPTDIRKSFDNRAAVDDIRAIKASDLDISKDGSDIVIGFAYRKEVPLFANVGVYIDFAASSKGR